MGVAWNVSCFFLCVIYYILWITEYPCCVKNDYFLVLFHCMYLFPCSLTLCAVLLLGVSPRRVLLAVLGTLSLLCHQTTSSYLEVSPQTERHWVSLTFCSGVARKNFILLKMISCLKEVWSAFQVMRGCTMLARMNGSLSNMVTQGDQGKCLIVMSTLMLWAFRLSFSQSVCVKVNPACRQLFRLCCVLQAVAHSMRWAWWRSVRVWRVCQQPVVSTKSCKTQVLHF